MNRGALCAPKDAFPLILRLQSSNDVCTQSGLVLLFVHFEARTPTLSHFVHRYYTFPLRHSAPRSSKLPFPQTNRLYKFVAHCPSHTVAIFSSVCAHLSLSHLHGSGCFMIMSPVPSSILEFQEASIPWSLDILRS